MRRTDTGPEASGRAAAAERQLDERRLPYNVDAEQSVLGAILVDVPVAPAPLIVPVLTARHPDCVSQRPGARARYRGCCGASHHTAAKSAASRTSATGSALAHFSWASRL